MSGSALAALRAADAAAGAALFAGNREPWLVRALLALHAATGAATPLSLLARAPDPHAKFLLDAILDQLREPSSQAGALAALPPLLYARPSWLHRLLPGAAPPHGLARELPRLAARLQQPVPLMHALLALAALLAAAPAAAPPMLPDLVLALLRPAALSPASPPAAAHLQQAQLALFHVLYATHPCSVLDALRTELAAAAPPARERLGAALAPLLASVRLHPALLARRNEADPARWARSDAHDVLAEARRLAASAPAAAPPPPPPRAASPPASPPRAPPGCSERAGRAALLARAPLADLVGDDSAPPTPLPPDEPPEPAVEATPENTPAAEARAAFRFPGEGGAARALNRSTPASPRRSPPADVLSSRLARLAAERRAAHSPVPLHAAAPPDAARPTPRAAAWPDAPPPPPPRPVRALLPRRAAAAPPPRCRRASSCPPRSRAAAATQTEDTWPEPHEFLLEDFYRAMPSEPLQLRFEETAKPTEQLDAYLRALYTGQEPLASGDNESSETLVRELKEQLALTHAALQYERWRRDAHAERNRRLLGSVRAAREADLAAAALHERLRAALRERDQLRDQLRAGAADAAALARLDAELAAERAARARADAALAEAAAARAQHAAELRRARGDAAAAARLVDVLARGAAAAERRAGHVRRLRRELLLLAEREAAAAPAPPPPPPLWDAALRAQLARVEAELEAAAARAELGAARAAALEAALAAREDAAAELRRSARAAQDAAEARRRALADKYAALRAAVRAGQARAAVPPPELADEPPPPLPPPA